MLRREFLFSAATAAAAASRPVFGAAHLNRKQRVDRALKGEEVDRSPFTFWHHFGLKTAKAHADRTLEFHNRYRTDIVKVMSDFPYPKPPGKWYELKPLSDPFPDQVRALELIRDGLNGDAYIIETIFNPFNVAEKLSSKEEVRKLKDENPDALLAALEVITQSEISHAKHAIAIGAHGILLAVANANSKELSSADYARFNAPFDKRILDAVAGARAAIELNGDPRRLDLPAELVPGARARGIKFVVSSDAHSVRSLGYAREYGVPLARRGGLGAGDVLNTLPVDDFVAAVRPGAG